MALRITQSRSAERAKGYYTQSLSREDYLTEGRAISGSWGGIGAERLGLSGEVDRETFFALAENLNPQTGERLTARTVQNRRVGYDLTFSVPKSVSLHQALLDHPEIEAAFESAVADTLKALEQDMYARVRRDGAQRERQTGVMVHAGFTHYTARPVDGKGADPHLHRHVFVFNATWDEHEQQWKAGEFGHLHLKRPYWEAVFHSRLAQNLRELGYEVDRTAHNFEIRGYRRDTLEKFAQRTAQIEKTAREKGIHDPARKGELGARTRAGKEKGTTVADLRERWWTRLTPEEAAAVRKVEESRGRTGRASGEAGADRLAARAVEESFERRSVVKRHEFLTTMLKRGVDQATVDQAHTAFERAAEAGELVVADWEGEACVTTPEVQREEERMLAYARETQGQCAPFLEETEELPPSRSDRERPADWDAAARAILGSRDRITMLIGKPGTGKTTVMQTVADALEEKEQTIHAFAPSANASRENQRRAGFARAETLAMLFARESLQEETRGQVIWVDEAGMVGARDMCRLFDLSERLGARVILTGDPAQHKPVDRGDAMRVLEEFGEIQPVRMNVIRRQTEAEYRQAAAEIAEGRIAEGFDRLLAMGAVQEIEDWDERAEVIAQDYARMRIDGGKSVLVVSPTHFERKHVNDAIREELQRRDMVGAEEREVVRWENRALQVSKKRDPVSYATGEKVKFHRAAPGFASGASGTVVSTAGGAVLVEKEDGEQAVLPLDQADRFDVFTEDRIGLAIGDEIRITRNGLAKSMDANGRKQRLSNGRVYRLEGFTEDGDLVLQNGFIVDANYANIDHGYAISSYASQSLDEDVVLVAQGHASFPASNADQFLVSVTRGRQSVRIYTDDREGLRDVVERSGARLSASELMRDEAKAAERGEHPEPEGKRLARVRDWVLAMAERVRARGRTVEEVELGWSATEPYQRGRREIPGGERRL